ncbi:MAG: hypothetical protein JXB26_13740 [Candidatus Aminicenantes bacterium]|nr:hypothetical protein [Candidatus Aminicenantes bacterium]
MEKEKTKQAIQKCRKHLVPDKVILCLKKLFDDSPHGLVAYAIGFEYEKSGRFKEAVGFYEKAESLFEETIYKNMARFAINNIVVDVLHADDKRKKRKKSPS